MRQFDVASPQVEGACSDRGDSAPLSCTAAAVAALAKTAGRLVNQLEAYVMELRAVKAARLECRCVVAKLRIAVLGASNEASRLDYSVRALAAEGAAQAAEERFSDAATSMAAAAGAQAVRDGWRGLLKRAAAALEEQEHQWHFFLADNEQVIV
jgi:hypothetical protein